MKTKLLFLLVCVSTVFFAKATDTLKVGYYHSPPFVIVDEGEPIKGLNYWLLNKIGEENGFHFQMEEMPLKDMINRLEKGTIDMSLIPLTISSSRSKKLDFTAPYYITHSGIMIKDEVKKEQSFDWIMVLMNFKLFKSIGLLLMVIVGFGLLLWLFERGRNDEFDNSLKGIGNGIWWSAVTMTTVGYGDKTPKTTVGRFIGIIWMFVAIMIISSITGAIASSLTVSNLGESNYELADFKKKRIGVLKGSVSEDWLKQHFYAGTKAFNSVSEILEALDADQVDAVAFGQPMLHYLVDTHPQRKYKVLDISYNSQMYSFGIKNNMPDAITEKIEYSLLKRINTKDWKLLLQEYKILQEE